MGIYIHIPFCSSKCRYCDFFSRVVNNDEVKANYVNALCKEIELQKKYLGTNKISTIYLGGGTPTVLKPSQLNRIFEAVFKVFDLQKDNEITIEVNPEDLTLQYLQDLKNYTPINRLSIGLQSFSDEELSFMNRKHSVETSQKAIENAQKTGFYNITGDLIFGLPSQTLEQWNYNLKKFIELNIPHLSAYSLTIEEGTVFGLWKKKKRITEIDEELSLKMYQKLIEKSEENNFQHYEISNFAKEGFIARHNFSYWTGEKYLGIGASAHSFDGKTRQWNVANIENYIKSIQQNLIPAEKETLTEADKFNEFILTGLRTYLGVKISRLEDEFADFYRQIRKNIEELENKGFVEKKDNHFVLTKNGKFVSDAIMSELMVV
ncbi:MAG: radical SAM family heme chaperone HemW [Bacteroidales bacterium]|nr:radical SAM family heme chaperone HemW [Bacteroidales bacterium]